MKVGISEGTVQVLRYWSLLNLKRRGQGVETGEASQQ